MKSKRVIKRLAEISFFLAVVFTFVWLWQPEKQSELRKLTRSEVFSRIENKEIKEAYFLQTDVELVDAVENRFIFELENEAARESLIKEIRDFNAGHASLVIKYREDPVAAGWNWRSVVDLPNLMFFLMWGLTLAVIVYAVRTLSRNKS